MTTAALSSDLVLGVISSILASVIVGGSVYLYQRGIWRDWYDQLISLIRPSQRAASATVMSLGSVRKILLERLRADQDRSGLHLGQFGRHSPPTEEQKFQTGAENVQIKPRIYLTLWPATLLHERKLLPRSVALAVRGVRQLLVRDRIYVYQAAMKEMRPESQPRIISYRHTMGGALILFRVEGISSTVRDILGAMIDEQGGWQNPDGGWAQCDREHTSSDLWASAYAARLLDIASASNSLSDHQRGLCDNALSRTLGYFNACWHENGWAYGGATTEENAVMIAIELASILSRHDKKLLQMVVAKMESWRTPFGLLSDHYLSSPNGCTALSLYTRMSYALLLADEPQKIWATLYLQAIRNIDQWISSADTSFLLDLTCHASIGGILEGLGRSNVSAPEAQRA